MQARYKWLLIPPAVALVLFIGPLRDVGTPRPSGNPAPESPGTTQVGVGQGVIPMPDAWQVASTLLGILLLGGAGVMLLARLRRGPTPRNSDVMIVRQSLRLSQRQRLHAIQFDRKLLLLGECEGQLTLLRAGTDPEELEDEARLEARDRETDEGAVPRDMLIPRPGHPAAPRNRASRTGSRNHDRPTLDDFKVMLRKVKAGEL